jgi:hypothetical protein
MATSERVLPLPAAPTPAKVIALQATALQAANLCFESAGVLQDLPVTFGMLLGSGVGSAPDVFDFDAFYATLRSRPTVPGTDSRLLYDSAKIEADATRFKLASLRAETMKATLDQAVNARENVFFAKYANAFKAGPDNIIDKMNTLYASDRPGSKPDRIKRLQALAADQAHELRVAYAFDQRLEVVKTTQSNLHTDGETRVVERDQGTGAITQFGHEFQSTEHHDTSSREDVSHSDQTLENTDYAYRTPLFESQAQYERAQISLIDEEFAQFMFGQNLPDLKTVFENELQTIDGNVLRLQLGVLNTILLSPFPGIVTGIYKNPGEWVRAGEPIVRVENNDVVLLVGAIVCRGPVSLGSSVTVETNLFDATGSSQTEITGTVVAARGQNEDDQWEVVVECDNLNEHGQPVLPLGYQFDYDDTTLSIG